MVSSADPATFVAVRTNQCDKLAAASQPAVSLEPAPSLVLLARILAEAGLRVSAGQVGCDEGELGVLIRRLGKNLSTGTRGERGAGPLIKRRGQG